MENIKQSKLEKIGIKYRDNSLVVHGEQVNALARNDYHKTDPYNESHPDTQWSESNTAPDGKPLGKGTNSGGHLFSIPTTTLQNDGMPSDSPSHQFDTENGGGSYDVWGRREFQSGRKYLENISLYTKERQYSKDSVTVDELIDGQFFVK